MRRFDEPPLQGQSYVHRPGVYGIFTHPLGLLLTCQLSEIAEWQLPGGGVEAGEHPLPALVREAYEETGWRVQVERKISTYRRFVFMPEYDQFAEKICHIYVGRAISKLGAPTEPDHYGAFFDEHAALEHLVNRGDRETLCHWLGKA